MPAPFRTDVLDDNMEEVRYIANDFSDLAAKIHARMPAVWDGALIGPDPGARTKNISSPTN